MACGPCSKSVRTEDKKFTNLKVSNSVSKQDLNLTNDPSSNAMRQIRKMKFESLAHTNWSSNAQSAMKKSVKSEA